MAYYYIYPPPDPYTVYLNHTFPEHHLPLEGLRHKIAAPFHHNRDQDLHLPKTDVRETATHFYIEVELPGLDNVEQMHLKWKNSRTLVLAAHIGRPATEEEAAAEGDVRHLVHQVVKERLVGEFERSFHFPVELHAGLVRIVLAKMNPEEITPQPVEVEHSGH
ncbi:hypothetical protein P152DRAFT_188266 [Eremomyces bilateralis CBS 781.70]|uniref:HSP20-like chaperone n=1 Tax=Eremomyces bilateralis CBS 781.70 TaxID=1392243 RepID=A0A6G1GC19_9PEZI|nr:uncharacterized protein P152DRAFT_188266 [Eremomyces bilateralis CBS 781.70]KAF1815532.1 hypothetical protein P152DRAFT_188266 [Eremomyces bilateralis CBS 781.70]